MNLETALPKPGRKAKPLFAEVASELTPEDLAPLGEERGIKAAPLKALRDKHHRLARALASGLGQSEAAYTSGFTPSRVSILRADPMFQQLESHYRGVVDAEYRDTHEALASLSADAVDVLHDRLMEDPDGLDTDQVLRIASFAADRSGHGPSQKQEIDVKVGLGDRLLAARKRLQAARDENVIEGTAKEIVE